jgi:RNA polymerase sigma-54 factor
MKASLQLRFSQNLALTPQLQQSIKLLQLSAMELEQELIQAAEQNPLINYESETSLSDKEPLEQLSHRSLGGTRNNQFSDEDDDRLSRISLPESLLDSLIAQIKLLRINPEEKALMGFVAGNLNERGYLDIDLESLAEDLGPHIDPEDGSALEQVKRALVRLQQLEPAGVGARDLAECLRLQLENFPASNKLTVAWKIAHKVCSDYLDVLANKDWVRIKKL